MNYKQRIVLIIGAAVLIYFLFNSPKISIIKGTYVKPPPDKENVAKMIDLRTAMTRAVAILGGTLLLSIALKDKKGTPIQSKMDREPIVVGHSQESERQHVRNDIIPKIIRFLKEFF